MVKSALPLAVLALVGAPSSALAQGEPTPAPTAPVPAELSVSVKGLTKGQVLAGSKYTVEGVIRPFVAGQKVTVRVSRHGRRVASQEVSVREDGTVGRFSLQLKATGHGTTAVQATHEQTAEMAGEKSDTRKFRVVAARAKLGSRGLAVRVLQYRLARKGYVVGRRGLYDARTARAVMAFRKVTGMQRTYEASSTVFEKLARGAGTFRVRFPSHGRHIEASLSRQVMALISRGKAIRIYPTSTGAPATPTIRGSFRVYRKDPGTNAKGMIHSSYFIRGYAIHGFASVPIYPASHGCLRVSPAEALSIYNWIRIGTPVDVYY